MSLKRSWRVIALLTMITTGHAALVRASDGPNGKTTPTATNASSSDGAAGAPTAGTTPAPIEEQLRQQAAILEQLQNTVLKQQAEIDRLRTELDVVRASSPSATAPAAAVVATDTTVTTGTTGVTTVASTAPAAVPVTAPAQDDTLAKKVENLDKLWGNLKLTGDVRFRYEGFSNQGFDALQDVDSRNRFRVRVRAQLAGKIDNHFDWAVRLASGGLDDPISTNATLDNYYNRKTIAIDRAFLHFTTNTKDANFDVYAGKFDYSWKRTAFTFDNDLQPEGITERLKFNTGDDTPLRAITLTAWQLPYKERSVGADAFIFGGQILTDWKWNDNWSSTLSGTFHDFEQVNVIPPVVGVSPTLINAGFDYATTNTVVTNPFTNLPEFRSDFRAIDLIGDVTYRGFGEKYPLTILAEWLRNTSAFNNQKDGGFATIQFGRKREIEDFYLEYAFWKAEREVFPSVFMESDVLQTNSVNHWVTGSYMVRKNVEFAAKYFFTRRLQTTSPENRWLNRYQLDMIYSF